MENHKWLEVINQNLRRLLAESELQDRRVLLHRRSDLSLEIIVDGKVYCDIEEIADMAIRDVIKAAIDKWQNQKDIDVLMQVDSVRHPVPSRRTRLSIWLIIAILVLVMQLAFIRPAHIAIRVGLLWTGAMIGGFVGVLIGRALNHRTKGDENAKADMLLSVAGGVAGVLLGFVAVFGILSCIP